MNKNIAAFIVFEGLDGTGKTETANLLAELMNAHYMTTPSEVLRAHHNAARLSLAGSQEATHLYYLSTVLAASKTVESFLKKGKSVILDRYYLSTQVYAGHRGSSLAIEAEIEQLLLPADFTIFLETDLDVRKGRIDRRNKTIEDQETINLTSNNSLLSGYRDRLNLPICGRVITINTSIQPSKSVAIYALNQIKNYHGEAA